ncbi:MAG: hypothetical protein ABW072_16105 [Sedimenticola sp.]
MMFVNPSLEKRLLQRLSEMKPPGGAVAYYDTASGSLVMVVASRESHDVAPELINWIIRGPLSPEDAKQELIAAGLPDKWPTGSGDDGFSIN